MKTTAVQRRGQQACNFPLKILENVCSYGSGGRDLELKVELMPAEPSFLLVEECLERKLVHFIRQKFMSNISV